MIMITNIIIYITLAIILFVVFTALKIAKNNQKAIDTIYEYLIKQQEDILFLNKVCTEQRDILVSIVQVIKNITNKK